MPRTLMLALVLTTTTAPALAQTTANPNDPGTPHRELPYDRGYDKPSARTDAINAPNAAKTADLNNRAAAEGGGVTIAPADQQQYATDMAKYRSSLRANRRTAVRDQIRYDRQQRAYADAMHVWRMQVRECNRGNRRACRAPTPRPGDFY